LTIDELIDQLQANGYKNHSRAAFKQKLYNSPSFRRELYDANGFKSHGIGYKDFESKLNINNGTIAQSNSEYEEDKRTKSIDDGADKDGQGVIDFAQNVVRHVTDGLMSSSSGLSKAIGNTAISLYGGVTGSDMTNTHAEFNKSMDDARDKLQALMGSPINYISDQIDSDDEDAAAAKSVKRYKEEREAQNKRYELEVWDDTKGVGENIVSLPYKVLSQPVEALSIALSTTGDIFLAKSSVGTRFFGMGVDGAYDELKKINAENPDLHLDDHPNIALGYSASVGVIQGLFEKYSVDKILGPAASKRAANYVLNKAVREITKRGGVITTELLEKEVAAVSRRIGTKVGAAALNTLVATGVEGSEELFTEMGNDAIRIMTNHIGSGLGIDGDIFDIDEMKNTAAERYLTNFAAGAVGGAGLGMTHGLFNNSSDYIRYTYATENNKDEARAQIDSEIQNSRKYSDEMKSALLGYSELMHDMSTKIDNDADIDTKKKMMALLGSKSYQISKVQSLEQKIATIDDSLKEAQQPLLDREKAKLAHINNVILATYKGNDLVYNEKDGQYTKTIGDETSTISELEYMIGSVAQLQDKRKDGDATDDEDGSFADDDADLISDLTRGVEAVSDIPVEVIKPLDVGTKIEYNGVRGEVVEIDRLKDGSIRSIKLKDDDGNDTFVFINGKDIEEYGIQIISDENTRQTNDDGSVGEENQSEAQTEDGGISEGESTITAVEGEPSDIGIADDDGSTKEGQKEQEPLYKSDPGYVSELEKEHSRLTKERDEYISDIAELKAIDPTFDENGEETAKAQRIYDDGIKNAEEKARTNSINKRRDADIKKAKDIGKRKGIDVTKTIENINKKYDEELGENQKENEVGHTKVSRVLDSQIDDENFPRENIESHPIFQSNARKAKESKGRAEGKAFKKTLANGEVITGKYILINKNDVFASHRAHSFSKTPGVPVNKNGNTFNDNDYERSKTAQAKQIKDANNYDQRAIEDPVLIDRNGVVKSGNGRTISRQMSNAKSSQKYTNELKERAEEFGFTKEQVEAIGDEDVMLAVELDGDPVYTTKEYAKYNEDSTKKKTPTEDAIVKAKSLDEKTISQMASVFEDSDVMSDLSLSDIDRLRNILINNGVISETNQSLYFDENGKLTASGSELIENILLASIFNENEIRTLSKLPSIRKKLAQNRVRLLNNRRKEETSVINLVRRAISIIGLSTSYSGSFEDKIEQYITQSDMFDVVDSDKDVVLMAILINDASKFRQLLDSLNNIVEGEDLFGNTIDSASVLSSVYDMVHDELSDKQKLVLEKAGYNINIEEYEKQEEGNETVSDKGKDGLTSGRQEGNIGTVSDGKNKSETGGKENDRKKEGVDEVDRGKDISYESDTSSKKKDSTEDVVNKDVKEAEEVGKDEKDKKTEASDSTDFEATDKKLADKIKKIDDSLANQNEEASLSQDKKNVSRGEVGLGFKEILQRTPLSNDSKKVLQFILKKFPYIANNVDFIEDQKVWDDLVGSDEYGGWYATDDETGRIVILLNPKKKAGRDETILHEVIHAFTQTIIDNPRTAAEREYVAQITELYNKFKSIKGVSQTHAYIYDDIHEFVTYTMTNTPSQRFLRNRLSTRSLFDKVIDAIRNMFGFPSNDIVNKVISSTKAIISTTDYSNIQERILDGYRAQKGAKIDISTQGSNKTNKVYETKVETKSGKGETVQFKSSQGNNDYTSSDNIQREGDKVKSSGIGRTIAGVWNKFKNIQFTGTTKVKNAADVAHIMRLLEDKSVEHAFAVHIDSKGNSHIQFLSIGGVSGTVVDPKLVLSGVAKFKSKKVYLVHNHPSGDMTPSNADRDITKKITEGLSSLTTEFEHIIMDTYKQEYLVLDKYGYTDGRFTREKREEGRKLSTHIFDGAKVLTEPLAKITSSSDVAEFLYQKRFSVLPKNGYLILNQQNNIIGNFSFKGDVNVNELLLSFGETATARSVIMYGNSAPLNLNEISVRLNKLDVGLLDYVEVKGGGNDVKGAYDYISAADSGLLNEVQAKYGTNMVNEPINDSSDLRFQILGEKGAEALDKFDEATHRMDNLSVARQMEEAGKTEKEIRLATGWERGKDKKWRYEINDYLQAVSDVYELQGKRKGVVNEKASLFGSKELNKAYPELENVQVKITISDDAKNNGSYEKLFINGKKDSSQITINATDVSKAQSILLHEMQHAIQEIEGFARGGSPKQFMNWNIERLREDNEKNAEILRDLIKEGEKKGLSPSEVMSIGDGLIASNNLSKLQNAIYEYENAPELYRSLAGEVEARNVGQRIGMTPEQRRETLLTETEDVAREDQIVMMDGVEQAMSLSDSESQPITEAESKTLTDWLNKAFGGAVKIFSDWEDFEKIAKERGVSDGEIDKVRLSIKKIGRTGKQIDFGSTNVSGVSKGLRNFFVRNLFDYDFNIARTGSQYFSFNNGLVDGNIRVSNHTKADDNIRIGSRNSYDVEVYEDGTVHFDIDTIHNNLTSKDISKSLKAVQDIMSKVIADSDALIKDIKTIFNTDKSISEKKQDAFNYLSKKINTSRLDPHLISAFIPELARSLNEAEQGVDFTKERYNEVIKKQEDKKERLIAASERTRVNNEREKKAKEAYNRFKKGEITAEEYSKEHSRIYNNSDIKLLQYPDGTVYGAVLPDGSMYLNPEKLNANTPIHEYTHLFNQVIQKTNPKLWNRMVEAVKGIGLWNEVKNDPNYANLKTDSQIADEVYSRIAGKKGEKDWQDRIAKADSKSRLARIRELIKEYWNNVMDFFGIKNMTANDFANMTLDKLFSGKEIKGAEEAIGVKDDKSVVKKMMIGGKEVEVKTLPQVTNGFYSPIEKKLLDEKATNLSATKWLERLGKGDEMQFTGLKDFLESKKPNEQVKKSDIQDFMRDNRIEVVEVVKLDRPFREIKKAFENVGNEWEEVYGGVYAKLSDKSNEYERRYNLKINGVEYGRDFTYLDAKSYVEANAQTNPEKNRSKFSQYQLEGQKENYKEIMIVLPREGSMKKVGDYTVPSAHKYGEDLADNRRVVHLRMNTRTDADGNKVLFLEEVQSDHNQEARKKGVRNEKEMKRISELADLFLEDRTKNQEGTPERIEYEKLTARNKTQGVPDAPFIKDTNATTKLGLKVALKEAVAQGADKIAWSSGEQQFDRWGSEEIHWRKQEGRTPQEEKRMKELGEKIVNYTDTPQERIEHEKLARKEGGYSLLINEQSSGANAFNGQEAGNKDDLIVHSKDDLRAAIKKNLSRERNESEIDKLTDRIWDRMQKEEIGTSMPRREGMKSFYGEPSEGKLGIVGQVAKSLFKQEPQTIELQNTVTLSGNQNKILRFRDWVWANETKDYSFADAEKDIENNNELYAKYQSSIPTQHAITITPEMRQQVQEGLPLFNVGLDVARFMVKSQLKSDRVMFNISDKYWNDLGKVVNDAKNVEDLNNALDIISDAIFQKYSKKRAVISNNRVRAQVRMLQSTNPREMAAVISNAGVMFKTDADDYSEGDLEKLKKPAEDMLTKSRIDIGQKWNEVLKNYPSSVRYLVYRGIYKFISKESEAYPIGYIKEAFDSTIQRFSESDNPQNFDFYTEYNQSIIDLLGEDRDSVINVDTDNGISGTWIKMNKASDSNDIEATKIKVAAASNGTSWCTKQTDTSGTGAKKVIEEDDHDFYVFFPKNTTQATIAIVPIREGEEEQLVNNSWYTGVFKQSNASDNNVDPEYYETVNQLAKKTKDKDLAYTLEKIGYSGLSKEEIKEIQRQKDKVKLDWFENHSGEIFTDEDIEDINRIYGISIIVNGDQLGLHEWTEGIEEQLPESIRKDFGNKLFKSISYIELDANFNGSQVQSLGNLQSIGGNAYFKGSQVQSLGNLQSIGGYANFKGSPITSLGNLQSIGGNAYIEDSQVQSLGNLQSIGGNAYFNGSQVQSLGNLQSIGGYANFNDSQVQSLGNLQSIGGYAYFEGSQVQSLGNLQSIGGYAYFNGSQVQSLGNLQSIGGNANFNGSQVQSLGNLQSIGGHAYFNGSPITSLGNLQSIGGNAYFNGSQVQSLGNLQSIGEYAYFEDSQVQSLGNLQSIGGNAYFKDSQVQSLGNLQSIGGNAYFNGSQVQSLGNLQSIGEYAYFEDSQVQSLGNLQSIGGNANFEDSQVQSLGNLQSIGGHAYFNGSQVQSLGNLQSIGGNAYFNGSQVQSLGNLQSIGGYANFKGSQVQSLGNLQSIGGNAYFEDSPITSLGNLQSIGGNAYFEDSQVQSLGNLQSIGGYANFNGSQVQSLGNLQSIGGDADFMDSKKNIFRLLKTGDNVAKEKALRIKDIFTNAHYSYLANLKNGGDIKLFNDFLPAEFRLRREEIDVNLSHNSDEIRFSMSESAVNQADKAATVGNTDPIGKVVINLNKSGATKEAQIKEFASAWITVMQRQSASFINRGLELVADTEYIKETRGDAMLALQNAIADHTSKLKKTDKLIGWVKSFWVRVGKMLRINISSDRLKEMTIGEFLDIASAQLRYTNDIISELLADSTSDNKAIETEGKKSEENYREESISEREKKLLDEYESLIANMDNEGGKSDTRQNNMSIEEEYDFIGRDLSDNTQALVRTNGKEYDSMLQSLVGSAKKVVETIAFLMPTLKNAGISVTLHKSTSSYYNAVANNGGSAIEATRSFAFYKDGQIHINIHKPGIKANVAIHEALHPIIRDLLVNNKPVFDRFVNDILNDKELRKKYYDDFAMARYSHLDGDKISEEAIIEASADIILARIIKGLDAASDSVFNRVLKYIKEALGKTYGKLFEHVNTRADFNAFANTLADGISKGMVISFNREGKAAIKEIVENAASIADGNNTKNITGEKVDNDDAINNKKQASGLSQSIQDNRAQQKRAIQSKLTADILTNPDINWEHIASKLVTSGVLTKDEVDDILNGWRQKNASVNTVGKNMSSDQTLMAIEGMAELLHLRNMTEDDDVRITHEAMDELVANLDGELSDSLLHYTPYEVKATIKRIADSGLAHPVNILQIFHNVINSGNVPGHEKFIAMGIAISQLKSSLKKYKDIYKKTGDKHSADMVDSINDMLLRLAAASKTASSLSGAALGIHSKLIELGGLTYEGQLIELDGINKRGKNIEIEESDKKQINALVNKINELQAALDKAITSNETKNDGDKEKETTYRTIRKVNAGKQPILSKEVLLAKLRKLRASSTSFSLAMSVSDPSDMSYNEIIVELIKVAHIDGAVTFKDVVEAVKGYDNQITENDIYNAVISQTHESKAKRLSELAQREATTKRHARDIARLEKMIKDDIAALLVNNKVPDTNRMHSIRKLLYDIEKNIYSIDTTGSIMATQQNAIDQIRDNYDIAFLHPSPDKSTEDMLSSIVNAIRMLHDAKYKAWIEETYRNLKKEIDNINEAIKNGTFAKTVSPSNDTRKEIPTHISVPVFDDDGEVIGIDEQEFNYGRILRDISTMRREIEAIKNKYRNSESAYHKWYVRFRNTIGGSMAMMDLSYFAVQGYRALTLFWRNPKMFIQAFSKSISVMADEFSRNPGKADIIYKQIVENPYYQRAVSLGLVISDPEAHIHIKEEIGGDDYFDIIYDKTKNKKGLLASTINVPLKIRKKVKTASNASFATHLNLISINTVSAYIERVVSKTGEQPSDKELEAIIRDVNNSTGRPHFKQGSHGGKIAVGASYVLWAPKLYASQIFNIANIALDPIKLAYYASRGEKDMTRAYMYKAANSVLAFATTTAVIYGLRAMLAKIQCGDNVGYNTEKGTSRSNWMKIQCGDWSFDPTGNHRQWIRLGYNLIKTVQNEPPVDYRGEKISPSQQIFNVLRYKSNPALAFVSSLFTGTDFMNRRYYADDTSPMQIKSRGGVIKDAFIPIFGNNLVDLYKFAMSDNSERLRLKPLVAVEQVLGFGVTYIDPKEKEERKEIEKKEKADSKKEKSEDALQKLIKEGLPKEYSEGEFQDNVDWSNISLTDKQYKSKDGKRRQVFRHISDTNHDGKENDCFVWRTRIRGKRKGEKYKERVPCE
jgi:hypothetical protein